MQNQANVAAVMARYMREAGMSHVFTYPGDPTVEFLEQLRREGLDVVLARREGTAAFMAEGLAQATGQIGGVVSTLGPGSTALVNGVAAAQWDRVPMLAISGQIETSREAYFTHQVVDHGALFGPITKMASRVEASTVGTMMRKALRTAVANRPGAVHLSVCGDVFKSPSADQDVHLPPMKAEAGGMSVVTLDGADPLARLRSARRPVILAGVSAVHNEAGAAITRLAETAGIPVVVAPMAKGVIREDHPNFAGVLDMACNDLMWDFLRASDLLLGVGFDAVELIKPWSVDVPMIHIDAVPNTDQVYIADVELIGDVSAIVNWVADEYTGEQRWSEEDIAAHRSNLRSAYYEGRVDGSLNPTDVMDVVRAAMPEDGVVSCDVGSHKLLVGQGWTTTRSRGVLMTNGLSSMGFGLPAAIGAKLAMPDTPIAALIGDGGFAMAATELRLASSLGANIAVVAMIDESLNRIELKQQVAGYPSTATRIEPTDLVKLAEAMECDGVRVDSAAELEEATANLGNLSRPLVIEARIDPAQYLAQF